MEEKKSRLSCTILDKHWENCQVQALGNETSHGHALRDKQYVWGSEMSRKRERENCNEMRLSPLISKIIRYNMTNSTNKIISKHHLVLQLVILIHTRKIPSPPTHRLCTYKDQWAENLLGNFVAMWCRTCCLSPSSTLSEPTWICFADLKQHNNLLLIDTC
jgi:hypothetical protein